jgi:sulfate adenylyltransferase subunit 1
VSIGQTVTVFPSGQTALVAQVLSATRQSLTSISGHSAGIVLDKEVDVSRGDWLLASDNTLQAQSEIETTVAWMDDEPLVAGRVYWALHGHRWVKAKVQRLVHRLNVNTLEEENANELPPNTIGHVTLALQQPLVTLPFTQSRVLGALVLVDTASHKTSAAVLVR